MQKLEPEIHRIPIAYRSEFLAEQFRFFRSRVSFFCQMATVIYFIVALQYVIRQWLAHAPTFKHIELWVWALLGIATLAISALNNRAKALRTSKRYAVLFNILFLYVLISVGVIYVESATVFGFYYAFALIFCSFIIPWTIREIVYLSLGYACAFSIYCQYVMAVMAKAITSLPRFDAYLDGLIFIGITCLMCIAVRRKEITRTIENFILLKQVDEKNRQMEAELEIATRVHNSLIPESIQTEKADIAVSYIPMRAIGGDYAKFSFLDEDRLMFFISDVTGHGVPAALMVNRLHAEFEQLAKQSREPGLLMRDLNKFILRDFQGTSMYLSAFCGLLDFKSMKLVYSNYGHPSQYMYQLSGTRVNMLRSEGGLLGIDFDDGAPILQNEMSFGYGDSILLFTDGVIETANKNGESFGDERIGEFVRNSTELTSAESNQRLIEQLTAFSDGEFKDDVFIVCIKTRKK